MTPSRSELQFASLVAYSPRGDGTLVASSQRLMRQLKENRVVRTPDGPLTAAAFVALRLRQIEPEWIDEFLPPSSALVPVPRSSLQKPGALWPAREIADAIHAEGYGARVLPCLARRNAVPKAATSSPKDRPKAQAHFDSLHVVKPLELPAIVTLVDDVVTRGAQLLGAAWRLWAVRPDLVIRAFVVMRTLSPPLELTTIKDPQSGSIRLRGDDTFRKP